MIIKQSALDMGSLKPGMTSRMAKFDRSFDLTAFRDDLSEAPIITELFKRWALPGERSWTRAEDTHQLRVAVRKGYLNLYIAGQSVAKLSASERSGLQVTLHDKYIKGTRRPPVRSSSRESDQRMTTLRGEELNPADPASVVNGWISTAATYCGMEKLFVDILVSHNSNVVDLEMALPGDERVPGDNGGLVSPRMDLVTVDVDATGAPRLNFWEAKCCNNSELRARADIDVTAETGPKVVAQLKKYMQWLSLEDRKQEVLDGYQEAAGVLLALADRFGKNLGSPACQRWKLLNECRPSLVMRPGLVVNNFHPRPEGHEDHNAMIRQRHLFGYEGADRLKELGLEVVVFDRSFQVTPLPPLEEGPLGGWLPA